jgi:hypothetical protein
MASAKLLPSGSWRVQACKTIDGKKIKKSFTVSPADCGGNSNMAKKKAIHMADEWMMSAVEEAHKISVKSAIESYLEWGSNNWSPSTYKDFLNMPKHFEEILDVDIKDVNEDMLQAIIDTNSRKGLSVKTTRNRINFIIAALKYKKIKTHFDLVYYKTLTPNLNPPEPSEFHRLLEMATPEEKLCIILAGLYTLRRGEIGGLYGEDLLWDLNRISVQSSMVKDKDKKWIRKPVPKNIGSIRVINIDPEIMKLFPKVGPKELVIKMNPDEITHHFIRLRKKAGVTCRFHDLRKYAASIRAEVMPSKYIEADGGWTKESVVMEKVYNKAFQEKRNEYAKKFNQKVVQDYGKELFGN